MKLLVILSLLFLTATAQPFYGIPWWQWWGGGFRYPSPWNFYTPPAPRPSVTEYAASLGGAPVGLFRRARTSRYGGGSEAETTGMSLGGAPVGLYGRERYDDWGA